MRIYVDLDHTLVNPVVDEEFPYEVVDIIPRPGAYEFLTRLRKHGEPWLLTASERRHAARALEVLGPAAERFAGVLSREDLWPVEAQIHVVESAVVEDHERAALWKLIEPVAPPGPVFDDFPVGSPMYLLKSYAVGIGPERWIQVEPFVEGFPDRGGLAKAYNEFIRRFYPSAPRMGRALGSRRLIRV